LNLAAKIIQSLDEITATEWNHLLPDSNPFIKHEFLAGLERYDCLQQQGWLPAHLVIYNDNKLVTALPQYIKSNSTGEFVFDWAWAEAFERAGGVYYPKLVSAIPFAPVTGPRLLVSPDIENKSEIIDSTITAITNIANENNFSSFHCLFPNESDIAFFEKAKLLLRLGCQYHWFNHNYSYFDDFLDTLNSKRRKQIKRERKSVREANIKIEILNGDEITSNQWEIFYQFYCSTFYRKWGEPRLTLEFFKSLSKYQPEATILLFAKKGREYIAGAYAMRSNDTLYGRHWGCTTRFNNLHFELCYYQTIEYCIKHGLKCLDAGAQGEHKISRGFVPVKTWSAHWIRNIQFCNAVKQFLLQERKYIEQYISNVTSHSPCKHIN
jgi:predicted N-acyltransferase